MKNGPSLPYHKRLPKAQKSCFKCKCQCQWFKGGNQSDYGCSVFIFHLNDDFMMMLKLEVEWWKNKQGILNTFGWEGRWWWWWPGWCWWGPYEDMATVLNGAITIGRSFKTKWLEAGHWEGLQGVSLRTVMMMIAMVMITWLSVAGDFHWVS